MESDHHPIVVMMKEKRRRLGERNNRKGREGRWTVRDGERIREKIDLGGGEEKEIDTELEARIRRIGEKLKEGVKENGGRKRKD